VEVVASLSQGRTAAAQCGLFTHKSVPVIFEPPYIIIIIIIGSIKDAHNFYGYTERRKKSLDSEISRNTCATLNNEL